ncbi:MAG: flippase [Bacteroidales bacterium]|nr:flippase [Bacteroidales bacterium]
MRHSIIASKIGSFTDTKEKKQLFSNFFSLSVLQAANYLLPLITLPYLVRVLGPEKYGLIAFAQAFVAYFQILTDYGFNLSATREISINRENKEKVSEIFSSVMTIKFCLLILSLIIMSVIIFLFAKFRRDSLLYYLTFGMVVGQVLFPVWFFQGMERMKYITYLNIGAKLFFTILIFVFIHQASDYIYVPLINSLGFIVAGIFGIWVVFKEFKINFKVPSLTELQHQLKEGWHIFISTIAISFYTVSNTFILGLFTNNTIVGYYSGAEKIIKAFQGLFTPVSQTIYPYISKLANESKEKAIKFIREVTMYVGGVTFVFSLAIFLLGDVIVNILLGEQYESSIVVLKILAFLPFIVGLSNIFGIQTMLTFDYKRAFSNILIIASIVDLLLAIILVPIYQHIGISFAALITEIFVTVTMYIYLRNKGIKILQRKYV